MNSFVESYENIELACITYTFDALYIICIN